MESISEQIAELIEVQEQVEKQSLPSGASTMTPGNPAAGPGAGRGILPDVNTGDAHGVGLGHGLEALPIGTTTRALLDPGLR